MCEHLPLLEDKGAIGNQVLLQKLKIGIATVGQCEVLFPPVLDY